MWSLKATALAALAPFAQLVLAQMPTPTPYTNADTGIVFDTWQGFGADITFGFAFPENALQADATELIGYLVRELQTSLWQAKLTAVSPEMRRFGLVRYFIQWYHDQQPSPDGLASRWRGSHVPHVGDWLRNARVVRW
jgi:Cytochrome domain of cellobiose dehydrogenase